MFAGIDIASERHMLARLDAEGKPLGRPIPVTEDQAGHATLLEALGPPPALIALGATMELRRGDRSRVLAVEDFYIEYGKQNRAAGEFVTGLMLPRLKEDQVFRCYKVTKRFGDRTIIKDFSLRIQRGEADPCREPSR